MSKMAMYTSWSGPCGTNTAVSIASVCGSHPAAPGHVYDPSLGRGDLHRTTAAVSSDDLRWSCRSTDVSGSGLAPPNEVGMA